MNVPVARVPMAGGKRIPERKSIYPWAQTGLLSLEAAMSFWVNTYTNPANKPAAAVAENNFGIKIKPKTAMAMRQIKSTILINLVEDSVFWLQQDTFFNEETGSIEKTSVKNEIMLYIIGIVKMANNSTKACMTHIKITKGLDIPLKGRPEGLENQAVNKPLTSLATPAQIALNFDAFEGIKFKLLVQAGDVVKIGQPLAEDKSTPGRMLISPAGGTVKEIRRGEKRSLQAIVIDVAKQEEYIAFPPLSNASKEAIIERLLLSGCFANIRTRPFNLLADPQKTPRSIFVKAIESAPCVPPAELQVLGHEKEFQAGLDTLAKLTSGSVHLVYRQGTSSRAFVDAKNVQQHTAEGPHPIANASLHIQEIDPILSAEDVVWTLTALDVVAIGQVMLHGKCHIERIVSIAGPGVLADRIGYFKARAGYPVGGLIAGRIEKGDVRFISGDLLNGRKVNVEDFLGYYHTSFCVVPENTGREFLHFMGLGYNKYSFSKAYLSGHLNNAHREYDFTTNQHGEHRAFIDSTLYDKVMPLSVPTMLLVKAIMAEDFELAETLGLLQVDSEDFALPTFVCPSKMEMVDIVHNGLKQYSKEVLT